MILIDDNNKNKCCGCTACSCICPQGAIEMKEDAEGFLYPVVDKDKCINCGLCDKVCPYNLNKDIKSESKEAYAIQNKDETILHTSTSGGFFSAICSYVISSNGYVCGATFDEKFNVIHKMVNTLEETVKFRGSKYVQSNLGDIFTEIKKKLDEGKLVCFSGTPCQVLGLKKFLQKDYENLITVDFVCRSVPSPALWIEYLSYQEKKYNSKIKEVYFRSKTYGYHSGTMTIFFENGKKYTGSNRVDLYNKSFHSNKVSRYSCYNCPAKGFDRVSDFTVFDSWKPDMLSKELIDNDKGFSNLIIHSQKGKNIFEDVKKQFNVYKIEANEAAAYTGKMLEKSIKMPEDRKVIYNDILNGNLIKVKKYVSISVLDKLFEKSKKILYKLNILKYLKKVKENIKK